MEKEPVIYSNVIKVNDIDLREYKLLKERHEKQKEHAKKFMATFQQDPANKDKIKERYTKYYNKLKEDKERYEKIQLNKKLYMEQYNNKKKEDPEYIEMLKNKRKMYYEQRKKQNQQKPINT